jgi:hypothetical protein
MAIAINRRNVDNFKMRHKKTEIWYFTLDWRDDLTKLLPRSWRSWFGRSTSSSIANNRPEVWKNVPVLKSDCVGAFKTRWFIYAFVTCLQLSRNIWPNLTDIIIHFLFKKYLCLFIGFEIYIIIIENLLCLPFYILFAFENFTCKSNLFKPVSICAFDLWNFDFPNSCCARPGESKRDCAAVRRDSSHVDVNWRKY